MPLRPRRRVPLHRGFVDQGAAIRARLDGPSTNIIIEPANDVEHNHPTARLLVGLIGFGTLLVGILAQFA